MAWLRTLGGMFGTIGLGIAGAGGLIWLIVLSADGNAQQYWNPLGLLIVLGGTLAATFVAFKGRHVLSMVSALRALFEPDLDIRKELEAIITVATLMGQAKVRAAEAAIRETSNNFVKLGLQLAVDGAEVDDIMHVLAWRMQKLSEREKAQAKLFRTLANFAPAFGMLGTLVGLVNMLTELGSGDLELIGRGLSIALITTVYGVVLANLVFRPIAIRLEQRTIHRIALMSVLQDGIILVRLGRSPSMVRDTLDTMMRDIADELRR